MRYSSDLSEEEWIVIERLLPLRNKTRQMRWSYREIMNGIMYQLKNGCNWGNLPKDFPPYSTVYWHYKKLRDEGIVKQINEELHRLSREKVKKVIHHC